MTERSSSIATTLIVIIGLAAAIWPAFWATAEVASRTVKGHVVATNLAATPSTIVVRVMMPNREELMVGARVETDTSIRRGKNTVGLEDIKTGEPVHLTYLKRPDGLIARSIEVHSLRDHS